MRGAYTGAESGPESLGGFDPLYGANRLATAPMTTFLVDTNVLSELWKPEPDSAVVAWLVSQEWFLPAPVIAEIQEGASAAPSAKRSDEINAKLDGVLSLRAAAVLAWDGEPARTWGRLKHTPEVNRQPQPLWDSLLQSMALRYNAVIATRDRDGFRHATTFNPWTGLEHPSVQPGA